MPVEKLTQHPLARPLAAELTPDLEVPGVLTHALGMRRASLPHNTSKDTGHTGEHAHCSVLGFEAGLWRQVWTARRFLETACK
jgi:hypothetical protein